METIRLGKTNLNVTRFGFGSIPIQRVSEEIAISVINKSLEIGMNYIDTANAYSTSEGRIGRAIAGRRDRLIIATKSTARTREGIAKHLALSFKQLGVDYIDLFQFHNVSDPDSLKKILDPDGPMAVIRQAMKAGRIKHMGITSHNMDTAQEAVKSNAFETIMFPFNFITSEPATDLLPLARQHDIGFIVMKPLAGGMLEDATLAFKYLLQFPDVLILVGTESVSQVEDIARVLNGPHGLTRAEKSKMQQLKEKLGTRFCRRCDYCQPCTSGIEISLVMQTQSYLNRLPPEMLISGWIADGLNKAAECIQCGDCEPRCPYKMPIMQMVEENSKLYQAEKAKILKKLGKG